METVHVSVLLREVLEGLEPKRGETVLDATLGGGGHAKALCQAIGEKGKLFGFDADLTALDRVKALLQDCVCNFTPIENNFRFLKAEMEKREVFSIDKAVFDLGLSSDQLEQSGRGFSFQRHEPLSMTFAANADALTAADVVNRFSAEGLENVFKLYGAEKGARKVAAALVRQREEKPFEWSDELAAFIAEAAPKNPRARLHPATLFFQALRMAVNDELAALEEGLRSAFDLLAPNGRLAVISFHQGEDRIVKNFFREQAREGHTLLTKKPIVPNEEEIISNPRARSAKLRLIQKS